MAVLRTSIHSAFSLHLRFTLGGLSALEFALAIARFRAYTKSNMRLVSDFFFGRAILYWYLQTSFS